MNEEVKFPHGKWKESPYAKDAGYRKLGANGVVDLVPIPLLLKMRGNELGKTDIGALKKDIQQNGLREPGILSFNPDTNHVNLGEGNHRAQALSELGYTHMPIRGLRNSYLSPTEQGVQSLKFHKIKDENGYAPGDMRPSHISPDLNAIPWTAP